MASQALSYADLGQRLGIAPASARRLVNRKRWPKTRGNDGKALVQVPDAFLADHDQTSADKPRDGLKDCLTDSPEDDPCDTSADDRGTEMADQLARARSELVEIALRLGAAQAKGEALEELVRRLEQAHQDLKADRDAWRDQAQRLALPAPPRRFWWPWRQARSP